MSLSNWHALATVLAVVGFAAVTWWALLPANKKRFDESANIVLETDVNKDSQSDSKE